MSEIKKDKCQAKKILEFFSKYAMEDYRYYKNKNEIMGKGRVATGIFEEVILAKVKELISKDIKDIFDLEYTKRWIDQGIKVLNYFWGCFFYNAYKDFPITISVFARGKDSFDYLCCIELDNNKASNYKNGIEEIYQLYCEAVKDKKDDGLDYILVDDDKVLKGNISKDDIINKSIKKGHFILRLGKKIEIGPKTTDDEIVKEIFEVFKLLIPYYDKIINASKELKNIETEVEENSMDNQQYFIEKDKKRLDKGYNKIYFGVPGVGKSHTIKKNLKEVDKENKFRITFHPEFTYNDFIGQIMPTIKKIDDDKEEITYEFQEGEFTKALKRAYANPDTNIYLILEEMSRGNCAAIFGDIFQLLDRDRKTNWSEFYINNDLIANKVLEEVKKENIEKYALEELKKGKIRIPSNMYILGTVNTSDQNVFAMDTAFKRRFEWEYIDTSAKEDDENKNKKFNEIDMKIVFDDKDDISIKWSVFYCILNKFISGKDYLGLGDDKQIGQAFIKFEEDNNKENEKKIRNKLLNYLWFDVEQVSYKSGIRLFKEKISNFSELYEQSKLKDEEFVITRINGEIFNTDFLKFIKPNKEN